MAGDSTEPSFKKVIPFADEATKETFGAGAVGSGVKRVTLASDDPAVAALANLGNTLHHLKGEYETVAAGQTDQILGATGGQGDYLKGLLIIPAVVACGAVSIKDGNGSSISIFVGGGTTALADAKPFYVPLGLVSLNATTPGWKVATGANVSVIGIGDFT